MTNATFAKLVLAINCAVPAAILAWDGRHDRLGANPLEFFTRTSGSLTLIFLTLSLAVTPARKLTGVNFLSHFRKTLGLYAFFYGVLHLLAYVWFTHLFDFTKIVNDTVARPYITFGMLGLFMMVPLAATSTAGAVRRMGAANWKRLHRLAYAAAVAGVVHYWLAVKADRRLPLAFAVAVAVLLGFRVYDAMRPRRRKAAPIGGAAPGLEVAQNS